jgi:hypothetical protein
MSVRPVSVDHEPHFELPCDFLLFVGSGSELGYGRGILVGLVRVVSLLEELEIGSERGGNGLFINNPFFIEILDVLDVGGTEEGVLEF